MSINDDILEGKHDDDLQLIAAAVRIRRSIIGPTTYKGYGPFGNFCVTLSLAIGAGAIFSALGAYVSPLTSNLAGVIGMILGGALGYWECNKVIKIK